MCDIIKKSVVYEIWRIFRPHPQTFCSHARTTQNIVILKKNLLSTDFFKQFFPVYVLFFCVFMLMCYHIGIIIYNYAVVNVSCSLKSKPSYVENRLQYPIHVYNTEFAFLGRRRATTVGVD